MNQLLLLLMTLLIIPFFNGCSSYPDSAEGVAKEICEDLKAIDFEAMKVYMSAEAILQMKERRKDLEKFFKSPKFAKIKEGIDCTKVTKRRELDHGRIKIHFGDDVKVKLKVIDGQWKMVI